MPRLLRFGLILLILAACTLGQSAPTPPAPTADALATAVAATLDAAFAQATLVAPSASVTPTSTATEPPPTPTEAQPTPSPSSTFASTASVSGRVCFKGGQIPMLTAYFVPKANGEAIPLSIAAGQTSYQINLPPGEYTAYAWTQDFSFGVSYSQAVVCGLGVGCTDHALKTFTVQSGESLGGIDLCDTTHGPFDVPLPPSVQPQAVTATIGGAISGYPGGSTPVLRVVAFNQTTGFWYWVEVPASAARYLFTDLPAGTYLLAAYAENGTSGGHPGLVTVTPGQTITDIPITDWAGDYPPDPTR